MTDLWPLKTLIATWKSRAAKTTCQGGICCKAAEELGQHSQWRVQNTAVQYNCICFAAALPGEQYPHRYPRRPQHFCCRCDLHTEIVSCKPCLHYQYTLFRAQPDFLVFSENSGWTLLWLCASSSLHLCRIDVYPGWKLSRGWYIHTEKVKLSKNVKPVLLHYNTKKTHLFLQRENVFPLALLQTGTNQPPP